MWLPIVDVSEHQGEIDFVAMKNAGVVGVIVRMCHGQTLDVRFWLNWEEANLTFPGNVGIYPFINPKRGGAAETAMWMINQLGSVKPPFIMLDVESYQNESPNKGVIWPAEHFADWLRTHVATLRRLVPDTVLIGYSNASFWNVYVQAPDVAASMDWIVPRYPVYSTTGYQIWPLPTHPLQWDEWAFARAPTGPKPPQSATWDGWQFSAGYNRQGPRYGCSSSDLDLNIVNSEAWNRWTTPTVPPPPPPPSDEEDMKAILYTVNDPAGQPWFLADSSGTVRQVRNGDEYQHWAQAGAIERQAESTGHWRQQLTTMQPIGALTPEAQAILGPEATADWNRRATINVTVTVPPIQIPHLNFSGTIVS